MTNLDSVLKHWDITLLTKACVVKAIVYPVVMDGCESWTINKTEHRRMMLLKCSAGEDSGESLGQKGNQPWIFIGRIDAKTETPILWPPAAKSQLIDKVPETGKDWGQEEKGETEDEMVG